MGFSSESKQNRSRQENGFSVNMLTACGRAIRFISESGVSEKSMSPDSPMIVPATASKVKSIIIKMLFLPSMHFNGLSEKAGSQERFISTTRNSLSRSCLKLKLNSSSAKTRHQTHLWNFDQIYNNWRKQELLDWMTPAAVYNNEINFNKNRKYLASGYKLCQQNAVLHKSVLNPSV